MTVLSERPVQGRKPHKCYHCFGEIEPGIRHIATSWLNDGCFQNARMHFECSEAWTEFNWGGTHPSLAPRDEAPPLGSYLTGHDLDWLEANYPLVARNLSKLTLNAPVVWC